MIMPRESDSRLGFRLEFSVAKFDRLSRRYMRMLSDGLRHAISFGGIVRAMIVLMISVISSGAVTRVRMFVR